MFDNDIVISQSDFTRYGCPNCGCDFARSQGMYGSGTAPVVCGECQTSFIILADGRTESAFSFGEENYRPKLVDHPRKGKYPHEFTRPDIRPKGIDGEFWEPRGVGYDLSGFVKSKEAGKRIVKMVEELIGQTPKSWLDYRPSEPLWIQVKIQKEDGFNLDKLYDLCKDCVITTERLQLSLVSLVV